MLSNLLKIIKNFIGNRYQQVALNRKTSGWNVLNAGVF